MEGRSLGPYEILEKLGTGGMGVVYLAQDTRLQRQVALKVIEYDAAAAADQRQLIHEARAAARLNTATGTANNPGQTNQVQGSRIRPRGDFGANLPFGTYKYSIRIRVRGSSTDLHVLDPELEVVEPTIIK